MQHVSAKQFSADRIEKVVFQCLAEYIGRLFDGENIVPEILAFQIDRKRRLEAELQKEREELEKQQRGMEIMESHIPGAMTGEDAFTAEELADIIRKYRKKECELKALICEKEERLKRMDVTGVEEKILAKRVPTWQQIFWIWLRMENVF